MLSSQSLPQEIPAGVEVMVPLPPPRIPTSSSIGVAEVGRVVTTFRFQTKLQSWSLFITMVVPLAEHPVTPPKLVSMPVGDGTSVTVVPAANSE
jgi:hypothetical protein